MAAYDLQEPLGSFSCPHQPTPFNGPLAPFIRVIPSIYSNSSNFCTIPLAAFHPGTKLRRLSCRLHRIELDVIGISVSEWNIYSAFLKAGTIGLDAPTDIDLLGDEYLCDECCSGQCPRGHGKSCWEPFFERCLELWRQGRKVDDQRFQTAVTDAFCEGLQRAHPTIPTRRFIERVLHRVPKGRGFRRALIDRLQILIMDPDTLLEYTHGVSARMQNEVCDAVDRTLRGRGHRNSIGMPFDANAANVWDTMLSKPCWYHDHGVVVDGHEADDDWNDDEDDDDDDAAESGGDEEMDDTDGDEDSDSDDDNGDINDIRNSIETPAPPSPASEASSRTLIANSPYTISPSAPGALDTAEPSCSAHQRFQSEDPEERNRRYAAMTIEDIQPDPLLRAEAHLEYITYRHSQEWFISEASDSLARSRSAVYLAVQERERQELKRRLEEDLIVRNRQYDAMTLEDIQADPVLRAQAGWEYLQCKEGLNSPGRASKASVAASEASSSTLDGCDDLESRFRLTPKKRKRAISEDPEERNARYAAMTIEEIQPDEIVRKQVQRRYEIWKEERDMGIGMGL